MIAGVLATGILACMIAIPAPGSRSPVSDWEHQETAVFKKLRKGASVPKLEALDFAGKKITFGFPAGRPCILAFLKASQKDSWRVLEALERLAADASAHDVRIVAIGDAATGADSWPGKAKGKIHRVEFGIDAGGAAKAVGVVARPCIAVLDKAGHLFQTHILYDDTLLATLKSDLLAIKNGKAAPAPVSDKDLVRFQTLEEQAEALESAGDLEKALAVRNQQLDLPMKRARTHARIARILLGLDRPSWALDHLESSLETQDRVPVRVLLAKCYFGMGKLTEAKKQFLSVIELSSNKADIHWYLARIDHKDGKIDSALAHMKKAIEALRRSNHGR